MLSAALNKQERSLNRIATCEVNLWSELLCIFTSFFLTRHAHLWIWSCSWPLCHLNIYNSASDLKSLHMHSIPIRGVIMQNTVRSRIQSKACAAVTELTHSSFHSGLLILQPTTRGNRIVCMFKTKIITTTLSPSRHASNLLGSPCFNKIQTFRKWDMLLLS